MEVGNKVKVVKLNYESHANIGDEGIITGITEDDKWNICVTFHGDCPNHKFEWFDDVELVVVTKGEDL